MKHFLLSSLTFFALTSGVQAYGASSNLFNAEAVVDTTNMDTVKTEKKRKLTIKWSSDGDNIVEVERCNPCDSLKKSKGADFLKQKPKVILGVTFARFDLGLTTLLDNGSFTLSPENDFLKNRTWKTINVGFDVFQFGYRFNEKFRLFLSAGFDWTHIRLQNNIIFDRNTTPLSYTESDINYSKNRFSSSYLRIPITFEHRLGLDRDLRIAYGPIGGFLLSGSQKFKSDEEGKRKVKDDFNYAKFRYGAFARVGYQWVGLYAKYYFNDMFENSPQQEGLRNMSFGLMFFF
ncbi:PorT family protein [Olivibacter sp. XZL3]|uniref:outer membrane beta-barrel protein n=1 Tax=Olivibacter sp. XZL3 TaxID=1735116 RepID=UPI0010665BB0|nr:PorT family protein [Olivibacter sp. XZL3]